nr:unnamed protein product [Callosobruchus chinensis]
MGRSLPDLNLKQVSGRKSEKRRYIINIVGFADVKSQIYYTVFRAFCATSLHLQELSSEPVLK